MLKKQIAFFAANKIGLEIIKFALSQSFPIEFVLTAASDKEEYEAKIATECQAAGVKVIRKQDPNSDEFKNLLQSLNLDLIFLAWWPKIIKPHIIRALKEGMVNMHPSLLPFGRGKYPYYWAIVENSPYGVSLHLIDEGIDTGPILFQKKINILPNDTGESLYAKSEIEMIELFKSSYQQILTKPLNAKPQDPNLGSSHFAIELDSQPTLDLEKEYTGRELINILRARTFLNGKSACFREGEDTYSLKLIIEKV